MVVVTVLGDAHDFSPLAFCGCIGRVGLGYQPPATGYQLSDGWVSLFDGKTLNGWTTIGGVKWSVVDGAMSAEPASQPITPTGDSKQTWPQGFLRSAANFSDFEMTAEFWSAEDTNSGLFIRCAAPANPGSLGSCYEINISDPHATTPTGGIVGVHSPLPYRVKSAGKWSRFDVLADGPHLVVKVNGETLTDVRDEKLQRRRARTAGGRADRVGTDQVSEYQDSPAQIKTEDQKTRRILLLSDL